MRHSALLLLPAVLAATRSLAFGIQSSRKSGARQTIPAETEYEILLVVIFCLTGLLVSLYLMTRFPELGAAISQLNQF
jgi:hypothetical protein